MQRSFALWDSRGVNPPGQAANISDRRIHVHSALSGWPNAPGVGLMRGAHPTSEQGQAAAA